MDDAKKLLDSLMGAGRNVDSKEAKAKKGHNFKEDNVCKFYLLGFCPQYEALLINTKRDLGKCNKVHSDAMVEEFEASPEKDRLKREYERQLRTYLEGIIRNVDDWIKKETRNVEALNEQLKMDGPNALAKARIKELEEEAAQFLEESESLNEQGKIKASKKSQDAYDTKMGQAKEWKEKATVTRTDGICMVCGARMESGDAEKAKARHDESKIHTGYLKLGEWLDKLKEKQQDFLLKDDDQGDERRAGESGGQRDRVDRFEGEKRRDREKRRDHSRSRSRPRDGDRDRDRGERFRARDGEFDDRGRDRGRDRNRGGSRDRGRNAGYSNRERSGERHRGRDWDRGRGSESDRGRWRDN